VTKLRVVIASPSDARTEREIAAKVVEDIAGTDATIDCVETFLWDRNVPPGFSSQPVQIGLIDPRARIADSDIVIVLFKRKIGTAIALGGLTGTEHEFQTAYESWRSTGRPQIMVYFDDTQFSPTTLKELEQYTALMKFRLSFPQEGLYKTFLTEDELQRKLTVDFKLVLQEVKNRVKKPFSVENFKAHVQDLEPQSYHRMRVPDSQSLYSSFRVDAVPPFLRLKVRTTTGHVPNLDNPPKSTPRWKQVIHWIYLIRDPIRPFEIQIGEYRAQRYGREPREVPFEGIPDYSELHKLYPLIRDAGHRWLRIVFAELLSDPQALEYMGQYEEDDVRKVIARNPSAPDDLKARECLFCDAAFRTEREIGSLGGAACIIANDFPFGPYFHYIVFPNEPVHSWDKVEEQHLYEMNWLAFQYLSRNTSRMGFRELPGCALA
jgi:hypothetical protein